MKCFVLLMVLTGLAGCSREGTPPAAPSPATNREEKVTALQGTAVGDFIDGAAGLTQARQGRQAADKVRAISEKRDADLNEVLDQ